MKLSELLPAHGGDLSPAGLNEVLEGALRTATRRQELAQQLQVSPRTVILHALELTRFQALGLAQITDDDLTSQIEPLATLLREGKDPQVVSVTQLAPGEALPAFEPETTRISITIGAGRCKTTITIEF